MCSDFGLSNCDTLENKASILQNLFELDSLLFEEYEIRLDSIEKASLDNEYSNVSLSYDSLKTKLNEVYCKLWNIFLAWTLEFKLII